MQNVALNAASFVTIFDGCQILNVTEQHLQFYYLKRFVDALKGEEERMATRLQRELEI